MKDINVIIINDFNYNQGGASKVALDTCNYLGEAGINTILFSGSGRRNANTRYLDYCLEKPECLKEDNRIKGAINSCWNRNAYKKLEELLLQYSPKNTIIHIHGWTKSLSSSVISCCFKKGFKVILTQHDYFTICPNGGLYNYKKECSCNIKPMTFQCIKCNCDSRSYFFKLFRIFRQKISNKYCNLYDNLNYLITISDFSGKKVIPYFPNLKIVKRIYNPIFSFGCHKVQAEKNHQYFYIGRLSKEKGIDLFCKAITQQKVKGVVIGDGSERKRLEEEYPNITFLGWKNSEDINRLLSTCRFLIFPSVCFEGAPLVPLEVMSNGIPLIVSNNCAAIDFIKNNEEGLYFQSGSLEDLCKKIDVSKNDMITKKLSRSAYDSFWAKDYSKERYLNELLSFYAEVLED